MRPSRANGYPLSTVLAAHRKPFPDDRQPNCPGAAGFSPRERRILLVLPNTLKMDGDVCAIAANATRSYRPNSTSIQMRSIDIWLVRDGKFAEHWDELNVLEVFQKIGAAMYGIGLWHRHILFDRGPTRSQTGFG